MNRQYLEYIPEIGTPAANSHHGQQQPLHQQPGCKAANPSNHHDVNACSPWADHVGDSVVSFVDFHTEVLPEGLGLLRNQPSGYLLWFASYLEDAF